MEKSWAYTGLVSLTFHTTAPTQIIAPVLAVLRDAILVVFPLTHKHANHYAFSHSDSESNWAVEGLVASSLEQTWEELQTGLQLCDFEWLCTECIIQRCLKICLSEMISPLIWV